MKDATRWKSLLPCNFRKDWNWIFVRNHRSRKRRRVSVCMDHKCDSAFNGFSVLESIPPSVTSSITETLEGLDR